ncbi:MAG: hypothetical protein WBG18_18830 [Xanthobacteraceae bacterium]
MPKHKLNKPFKRGVRTTKNSHTSPRALMLARRRSEAWAYKVQGHTVREIGRIMKLHPSTIHSYVVQESERVPRETREQALGILLDGLNEVRASIYPQAIKGDIPAAAEYRKQAMACAALLGVRPASVSEVGASVDWNIDVTQNITRNVTFVAPNPTNYENNPPPQGSWQDPPGPRLIEHKPTRPRFGDVPEPPGAPPSQESDVTPPANNVTRLPTGGPKQYSRDQKDHTERARAEGWGCDTHPNPALSAFQKSSGKNSWMR